MKQYPLTVYDVELGYGIAPDKGGPVTDITLTVPESAEALAIEAKGAMVEACRVAKVCGYTSPLSVEPAQGDPSRPIPSDKDLDHVGGKLRDNYDMKYARRLVEGYNIARAPSQKLIAHRKTELTLWWLGRFVYKGKLWAATTEEDFNTSWYTLDEIANGEDK